MSWLQTCADERKPRHRLSAIRGYQGAANAPSEALEAEAVRRTLSAPPWLAATLLPVFARPCFAKLLKQSRLVLPRTLPFMFLAKSQTQEACYGASHPETATPGPYADLCSRLHASQEVGFALHVKSDGKIRTGA